MKALVWTERSVAEFSALWNDPFLSAEQIARELGITPCAVRGRARKLCLVKPRHPVVRDFDVVQDRALVRVSGCGGLITTTVSSSDLSRILSSGYRWNAHADTCDSVYVYGYKRNCRVVKLHRFLINAEKTQIVDHVNGDTLDNRRENLRIATWQQNAWNTASRAKKHGYKGIWFHEHSGLWTGTVRNPANGHRKSIGYHLAAEDAARARDALATEYHGEFARLNFPACRDAA